MAELRIVIPDNLDRYLDTVIKSGMFGNKAELARAAIVQFLNTIGPISKGYDTDNLFSPDGRIFQIEYAKEASNIGVPVLGIVCTNGIFIASEDIISSLDSHLMISPIKIHRISDKILIGIAGLVVDGAIIIDKIKDKKFKNEDELLQCIREIYWSHTIKKDVRPLGISLIIGTCFDRPRLFEVDPSGAIQEFKATVIGSGKGEATKRLNDKFRKMDIKEAGSIIPAILGKDKEFMVETLYLEE